MTNKLVSQVIGQAAPMRQASEAQPSPNAMTPCITARRLVSHGASGTSKSVVPWHHQPPVRRAAWRIIRSWEVCTRPTVGLYCDRRLPVR